MFEHFDAINLRLSHERGRVAMASGKEKAWREHNVKMIEKELESERKFLAGKGVEFPESLDDISDDELLALLG